MNSFTYSAYYCYQGPSASDPFRTEKTPSEVSDALRLFPGSLRHFLPEDAEVAEPATQPDPKRCLVTVMTNEGEEATNAAVARCLNSHDLYADRIKDARTK